MRLIDADKIYPWYVKAFSAEEVGKERAIQPEEIRFSMRDIKENLDNIPTEQEPKTGHWTERKKHEITGLFLPTCSVYGKIQPYTHHTFRWNYCPNCGAKMESEGSE